MCKIVECVIALLLVLLAYEDWKKKRISIWVLGFTFIICIVARVIWVSISVWNTVGGVLLGFILLGISKWSKEAIGYGDSLLALALGIYMGGIGLLEILSFASFLACIYSLIYCMRHGWNRKYALPYIPFVALSYVGGLFL